MDDPLEQSDPTGDSGDPVAVIVETVSANEPCKTCSGFGTITDEIICGDCAGTGTRIVF